MSIFFTILLLLFVAFIVWAVIEKIKNKAYHRGYRQAETDVVNSILDTSYWLASRTPFFNALYLYATTYKKCGNVNPEKYRRELLSVNPNTRIIDIKVKP